MITIINLECCENSNKCCHLFNNSSFNNIFIFQIEIGRYFVPLTIRNLKIVRNLDIPELFVEQGLVLSREADWV